MKTIRLSTILLVLLLFLSGCSTERSTLGKTDIEPTTTYDWMAGESPVPTKRIGVVRYGTNMTNHAISPNGIYFIKDEIHQNERGGNETWFFIIYADHGSDTFVKLCGRIDCSHDNEDCNAYVPDGSLLSFYRGYLYVATGGSSETDSKLIRMKPDGSDHEVLFDFLEFAKDNGGDMISSYCFSEGLFMFDIKYWKVTSSSPVSQSMTTQTLETYRYRIDGSEGEPSICNAVPFYYCGDNPYFLATGPNGERGLGSCDLEKNEVVYLCEHPGVTGYFDKTAGYYYKNGAICRLDYATNTEQSMVQTGLSGDYLLNVFPDCMVLASREEKENAAGCKIKLNS